MSHSSSFYLQSLMYDTKLSAVKDCSRLVERLSNKYKNDRKGSQEESSPAIRELISLGMKTKKNAATLHANKTKYVGVKKQLKYNIAGLDEVLRCYERMAEILTDLIKLGNENANEVAEAEPEAAAQSMDS